MIRCDNCAKYYHFMDCLMKISLMMLNGSVVNASHCWTSLRIRLVNYRTTCDLLDGPINELCTCRLDINNMIGIQGSTVEPGSTL